MHFITNVADTLSNNVYRYIDETIFNHFTNNDPPPPKKKKKKGVCVCVCGGGGGGGVLFARQPYFYSQLHGVR